MSNKILHILVTGANGQLGKCLKNISIEYPQYKFYFKSSSDLNITDAKQINHFFQKEKYNYCINCAAYTAVDKAENEPEKAYLVNSEAVKHLAEACKQFKSTLIHISTDFVFDGTNTTPYTEEANGAPLNVYGSSKLKGENYIQTTISKYFIIRTSWVFSEHGNNFVKTMLRLGKERNELSVVDDQIGSPTYAADLASFILHIVTNNSTNYGIYNYSNEGEISWYDFAKEIFKQKNIIIDLNTVKSKNYITPATRPLYSVMDKTKAKNNFNVKINNWKISLKECLKTFKE
ncbi:dTDP-4-dehydrorhamnose reductase [Cellulophaga sp. L1A9]|uniref:dTDP-4-dehydrorhamnose reductase n=1 Tax=Cellulophaga sp. L1A9 TaxID=2686362 RepID=UPI00131BFFED|nr:dTDP-4-dehydrorhamnose reductase [Cellulophaga sp. L1A9]